MKRAGRMTRAALNIVLQASMMTIVVVGLTAVSAGLGAVIVGSLTH